MSAIVSIPLQKVPAQQVAITLSNQRCIISLRQHDGRQYFSLSVNGDILCAGVLLVDNSQIVRAKYKGFKGEFLVVDTRGNKAPEYSGWSDRWLLLFNPDA